jgi:hypothetical protein
VSQAWEELDEQLRRECVTAVFRRLPVDGEGRVTINGDPVSIEAIAALYDLAQHHDRHRHGGGELVVLRDAAKRHDAFRAAVCKLLDLSAEWAEDYDILEHLRQAIEADERS